MSRLALASRIAFNSAKRGWVSDRGLMKNTLNLSIDFKVIWRGGCPPKDRKISQVISDLEKYNQFCPQISLQVEQEFRSPRGDIER
jgi:hypothetical protein